MAAAVASPQPAELRHGKQALTGMICRIQNAPKDTSVQLEQDTVRLLAQFGTALQQARPQLQQELHTATEAAESLAGRLQSLSYKLQNSVLNPLLLRGRVDTVQTDACARLRTMLHTFKELQAAHDEEARDQLWEQLLSGDSGPVGGSDRRSSSSEDERTTPADEQSTSQTGQNTQGPDRTDEDAGHTTKAPSPDNKEKDDEADDTRGNPHVDLAGSGTGSGSESTNDRKDEEDSEADDTHGDPRVDVAGSGSGSGSESTNDRKDEEDSEADDTHGDPRVDVAGSGSGSGSVSTNDRKDEEDSEADDTHGDPRVDVASSGSGSGSESTSDRKDEEDSEADDTHGDPHVDVAGPALTIRLGGPADAQEEEFARINILVCGASGLGKSTFIETLVELLRDPDRDDEFNVDVDIGAVVQDASFPPLAPTVETKEVANIVVKQRDKVDLDDFRLSFIDAVGYGGQVNNTAVLDGIEHVLQDRMQKTGHVGLEDAPRDYRIHLVLYFIAPHRFQQIDAQYIYRLARYAPIIPVLAKADTLDIDPKRGRAFQRKHILREILEIDDLLRGYEYREQQAMEEHGHSVSDNLFQRDIARQGANPANDEQQDGGSGAPNRENDEDHDDTVSTDGERSTERADVENSHRDQPLRARPQNEQPQQAPPQHNKRQTWWRAALGYLFLSEQKVLVPEGAIFPARALRRGGARDPVRKYYTEGLRGTLLGDQIVRPGPRDIFLIIADKTLRREYLWSEGGAQVMDPRHCDFLRLAKLLVNGDHRPLRLVTAEKHKRYQHRVLLLGLMRPFNTLVKQLAWCLLLFILQLNGAVHNFFIKRNMEPQWLDVIFVCLYLMCIVGMVFRAYRSGLEWFENRKLSERIQGQRGTDEFHDGTRKYAVQIGRNETVSKDVHLENATRLRLVFRIRPIKSFYSAIRDWFCVGPARPSPVPYVHLRLFSTNPDDPGALSCRFTEGRLLRGECEAIVMQGHCFVQATCTGRDEANIQHVSVEIAATSLDHLNRPNESCRVGAIPTVSRKYLRGRVKEERWLGSRRFWSLLFCLLLAFLWVRPYSPLVQSPQVENTGPQTGPIYSITPTQSWLFGLVRESTDAVVRWAYRKQTGEQTDTGVCADVKNTLEDKMREQRRIMDKTCEKEKKATCQLCEDNERTKSYTNLKEETRERTNCETRETEKIEQFTQCDLKLGEVSTTLQDQKKKNEVLQVDLSECEGSVSALNKTLSTCERRGADLNSTLQHKMQTVDALTSDLASCKAQRDNDQRKLRRCQSSGNTCLNEATNRCTEQLTGCQQKTAKLTNDLAICDDGLTRMRNLCKHNYARIVGGRTECK